MPGCIVEISRNRSGRRRDEEKKEEEEEGRQKDHYTEKDRI